MEVRANLYLACCSIFSRTIVGKILQIDGYLTINVFESYI